MWRIRRTSLLACVIVMAGACGAQDDEFAIQAAPTVPPVTVAATTAQATTTTTVTPTTTTVAPTTTTDAATTTTLAPTTTAPPPSPDELPVPDAPPPPGVDEPVIEVGSIEIPALGVLKVMYEGITLDTLDHGPGHWPGTASPGQYGNVVVAGHRTSHDRPFYDLDKLALGDLIVYRDATSRHVYSVTATEIVNPDALWIVDQTVERTTTLFACHPKGSTRQRIVVRATFVETLPL